MDLEDVYKNETGQDTKFEIWLNGRYDSVYDNEYVYWLEERIEKPPNKPVEHGQALNCYHHTRCDDADLEGCDKKCRKYEPAG